MGVVQYLLVTSTSATVPSSQGSVIMKTIGLRLIVPLGAVLLPALSQADCATNTTLNVNQLTNLLAGNTVCGRPDPNYPGSASDRWQEQHRGSGPAGQLWDYKLGSSSKVDPTSQVGSWSIQGSGNNGTVTHAYTGGLSFTWTVHGPNSNSAGSVYYFCSGGSEFAHAYVITGQASCGSSYPP
jgi:hypothetical protein